MRATGLRVTATLGAPVEGDHALHLDGLLAEASFRRQPHPGAVSRQTPAGELADLEVPLARIRALGGYMWASSAWVVPAGAGRVMQPLVRRKDAEDLDRLAVTWTPGSGPGRNLMLRYAAIVARSLSWVCVGSRREVRKALQLFSSIGDRRRHGNGRVLAWDVVEDETVTPLGCLVSAEGVALRHLPVSWCERVNGEIGHGAHRAPYWHPGRHGPVVMPGARVELREDVIAACTAPEVW